VPESIEAIPHEVVRPDGARIHLEARGEGPVVMLCHHAVWSHPAIYGDLIADLARDHRAIVYDPRGCGRSSRRGPYELETDADDLAAVVQAAGGAAVVIAVGDGFNRAARVAAARPDLLRHVLAIGPAPAIFLPRTALEGSDSVAASESVVDMLLQMMTTDPRAALRTIVTASNPDLDEDAVRERVDFVAEYVEAEATLERARKWLADDVSEQARILGDRLWIMYGGADPLFEGELGARVADSFPKAHLEEISDGPVSRPELTAARVRALTAQPSLGG
jgi:pimeloyl-ACP methyl ester carboxylesterase